MQCLACDTPTTSRAFYPGVETTRHLTAAFGRQAPAVADYYMAECPSCGLRQAVPMREPPVAFYEWLAESTGIYHHDRWEWHALMTQLRPGERVADVGCGAGAFLATLRNAGWEGVGLELSEKAAAGALAQGLQVIVGSFDQAKAQLPGADVVTLWHVVEHVADPVGMLQAVRDLLSPGGRIVFSVPVSPMSAELDWFDPLSYPPHHLTQWTPESVLALADKLGMVARLHLPKADPLPVRWARNTLLRTLGPYSGKSPNAKALHLAAHALRHPLSSLRALIQHAQRRRYDGAVLPDVMMVELTAASAR